ncbi:hypothetical protein PHYC_00384 [Phycisphaerales bacterium]|nr:hypothetical protein PHYC_00384 [Phycisphaerales bacterium]
MGDAPDIGVWLEPRQTEFVRAVVAAAGCRAAFAGSPVKGQSGGVAAELGAEPFDDLRAAMAAMDVRVLWLASAGEFGAADDPRDSRALADLHGRGCRLVSSEPIPASPLALSRPLWTESEPHVVSAAGQVRFAALPRAARVWRDATETLEALGPARLVQVEAWGGPAHGSLGARVFGAMDLVFALLGEPASVDAVHVGPRAASGVQAGPAETLRNLDGDLTATMRFEDGRAAVVAASNAAGRWNTLVTLVSEQGRLRVFDDGWEWIGPDGAKRDESRAPKRERGKAGPDHGVAAAAESLMQALGAGGAESGPVPLEAVLPITHAALLSAKTGQPESPATIRRLAGL